MATSYVAAPFLRSEFGFNRGLEQDPAKLTRIMSMVDAITADDDLFLLTQFDIGGRYPTQFSYEGVNTGRF